MFDFDIQPKMVGRENELKELQAYLNKAAEGQGNTVFIPGEAGVGKTRLVNELKEIGRTQGFQVLSGNSMYESLIPYLPFIEALRSGGYDYLFAEEAPKIESVYLMTHSGKLIKEQMRHESKLNPDILAAMLTGVSNFVNETLSILSGEEKEGSLNSLGYENYRILIESGKSANLVVILTGRENEFLLSDMKEILQKTEKNYGKVLDEWDGDEKRIEGTEEILQPLILSGKYDGIYYGKEDPKARRDLLFENVSMGLIRQTKKTPTILCIEDLQWADPSTLALMHYVGRNTKNSGLLILGTYRPEDVVVTDGKGHPLINTIQLMDREDLHKKMELQRLPREILDEFLSSLLGKVDFSDEFKNRIHNETEGNPLFVIQLVKFLVEEDIIRTDNGVWKLAMGLEDISIPPKVYHVIERRLDQVEKEYRKVLDYASVIGETFSSDILASALKHDRIHVLEQLREIEHKHRLVHSQNGNYKFDHAKIKEVLYEEIPKDLRGEYHLTIANSVEELNKDNLDGVVGELAFHYYNSRNKKKALNYLLKAAEKARREYSNEEAIRFYKQALEFEEDNLKRLEILMKIGNIKNLIGEYDKSIDVFKKALELATDMKKKAEIIAKIGEVHIHKGEYEEAINTCNEALDLIKDLECMEEAFALYLIGVIYMRKGNYDKSLEYSKKCLKISEKFNDLNVIADSLRIIGAVYSFMGDSNKALRHLNDSLSIYNNIKNFEGISTCLGNIGNLFLLKGEYNKALENFTKSLEIKEKIGEKRGISACYISIAAIYADKGEHEKALEYTEMSLKILKKINFQLDIAICLLNIGEFHCGLGNYKKALDHLNKSRNILEKIGAKRPLTYSYKNIALVFLKKKDLQKALAFCVKAFDLSNEIGYKRNIATSMRIFGIIYKEEKKWNESIENFEESLNIFKEMGNEVDLAETYYEFGLMWKRKGDSNKAKDILNVSLNAFIKLKLEKWVEIVSAALKTL